MPSVRTLVIAGAATLVVGLVIAVPARLAWQWLAPPGVALQDISGTIWRGRARQASVGGLYLTDVRWRFAPGALLGGRVGYSVSAVPVSGVLEADVSVGAGGRVHLADVAASLPIEVLQPLIAVDGLDGDLDLQIDSLVVDAGLPVEATGTVGLTGLVIRPLAPSVLGDFQATVETVDGVVRGEVEDLAGVLDATGIIELHPDRNYFFTGQIATRQGAPAAVEQQLQFLGSADAQGRRSFRFEGRL